MGWSPSYDGYDLTKVNGVSMPEWDDHGPAKATMVDLLTGGSEPKRVVIPGRTMTSEFRVVGDTATQLQSRIEALLSVLHQPGFAFLRLDNTREILAFSQPGKTQPIGGADGVVVKIKVKWVAKDPYWRSTTKVIDADSAATLSTLNFTNAGGAPARFNFQVENVGLADAVGQTITVKNKTTGKEFRLYKFDLDAGDILRFDEDGQIYLENPVGATSRTPIRVDGDMFDISGGANVIEITHNMGTDAEFSGFMFSRFHYHGAT